MILLNFSHPLTQQHLSQTENLTGKSINRVIDLPVQFDNQQSFLPQLQELVALIPLDSQELQNQPILINPPSLNFITALLLAELHGRMGYFPPIIRTRPVADSLPPQYEVAEILNLQNVRDHARTSRF